MSLIEPLRMDADTFLDWSLRQDGRYELMNGEVIAMASERVGHNTSKLAVAIAMTNACRASSPPVQIFTDGMAVRIDAATVYEPDAALRLGAPLNGDETIYSDPLVVVEVASPSTQSADLGAKLTDYFRLPSLRHYLIVRTDTRTIIHHLRGEDGTITTAILTEGAVPLDPPGIALAVEDLFG